MDAPRSRWLRPDLLYDGLSDRNSLVPKEPHPSDFDSATRVRRATEAIRRLLDGRPPNADPWDFAANVVRTFLRAVGYPKGKEKHLFDDIEVDRVTLAAWVERYR